jgi:DNA-binding NarL/FixJ family response regulator
VLILTVHEDEELLKEVIRAKRRAYYQTTVEDED